MSFIVVLDAGHGGRDSGAVGNKTYEKNNNLTLALKIGKILTEHGVITQYTRTSDQDFCSDTFDVGTDLQNRIAIAKQYNPDAFVSVHNNAFDCQAKGIETHCYKLGGTDEKITRSIQDSLSSSITSMINRGIKVSNLYVTRKFDNTKTSACLVEYGFIDSEEDMILANLDIASVAIAKGILSFLGIEFIQEDEKEMKNAVLIYTKDDSVTGFRVAEKFGNCAVFVRRDDMSASPEVMNSETLYILGGGSVGHPNETILSGVTWWDTVVKAKTELGF